MKTSSILLVCIFLLSGITLSYGQEVEINNKNIKSGTYTSKTKIKATGKVKKGTQQVVFKAEEGITLGAGFSSEQGTDVIFKIDEVDNNEADLKPKGENPSTHAINISPNPFKYATTISFALPKKERASISIYDEKDNLVKQLLNSEKEKGLHELEVLPNSLSSGVYKVVLKTSDAILVQKMILIQ